jgi:hypothetical protein
MRFRIVSLILLSSTLGLAATVARADAPPPPAAANAAAVGATPPATPPPAAPKLICRSDEGEETGSHVPHRTCLTQADWDRLDEDPGPRYVTQVPIVGPNRTGGMSAH